MATAQPKSGVVEYTTSTGTGALTLTGAAPGFRGFVSADNGLVYHYAIFQDQIAFETGLGTYNHALRQLSRTTVLANINGTSTPLNLGAGTKEVSIVIPGERAAMTDVQNVFTEDQVFSTKRLYLDEGNSWIETSSDDIFRLFLNSTQMLDANYFSGLTYFQFMASNATATEGPTIVLRRDSTTPAALDALAAIFVQGKDSSLASQMASKIRTYWQSVTAGSHSAVMEFSVANAGALQNIMNLGPSSVRLPSGIGLFTGGKTSTNLNVVGAELFATGEVVGVCSGAPSGYFYRTTTANGNLVLLGGGGTALGDISISSGNILYNAFTGGHYAEWAPGVGGAEFEDTGTVVSTADGTMGIANEPAPLVRPACGPNDRAVYGTVGSRQLTQIGGEERSALLIHAVGDGFIKVKGAVIRGDLLRASLTPGVAESQPDDIVRSSTVAKATQSSSDDGGSRLVECVYMAG